MLHNTLHSSMPPISPLLRPSMLLQEILLSYAYNVFDEIQNRNTRGYPSEAHRQNDHRWRWAGGDSGTLHAHFCFQIILADALLLFVLLYTKMNRQISMLYGLLHPHM